MNSPSDLNRCQISTLIFKNAGQQHEHTNSSQHGQWDSCWGPCSNQERHRIHCSISESRIHSSNPVLHLYHQDVLKREALGTGNSHPYLLSEFKGVGICWDCWDFHWVVVEQTHGTGADVWKQGHQCIPPIWLIQIALKEWKSLYTYHIYCNTMSTKGVISKSFRIRLMVIKNAWPFLMGLTMHVLDNPETFSCSYTGRGWRTVTISHGLCGFHPLTGQQFMCQAWLTLSVDEKHFGLQNKYLNKSIYLRIYIYIFIVAGSTSINQCPLSVIQGSSKEGFQPCRYTVGLVRRSRSPPGINVTSYSSLLDSPCLSVLTPILIHAACLPCCSLLSFLSLRTAPGLPCYDRKSI